MKTWFKKVAALMAIALLTLALAGCGAAEKKDPAKDSAADAIKKKGKLVVGTATGYYPFEMTDKAGQLVGFDIAVAKQLGKELGVEIEFQNYAFSGLIPALQANKVDLVIAGMTITDKRKEVVDFSDSYFTSGQAMLVSKKYPDVKKWEDLDKKGNVIAVSMGTTADQTASKMFKNAEVKKFEGSALAGLELLNGNAVAVIHEVPWVAVYNKMNSDTTYAILEPFTTEELGIAVPKGNEQLLAEINKFVKKYKAGADYKNDYNYWFVDMKWWDSVPPKK
ncbi:MAG TPA: transporter substrate-binding domain-containing protein [Patescibacteria group bacterium]|nr:transporter substrate-binding domain-containing protein [Patescibacteria group bacterium]